MVAGGIEQDPRIVPAGALDTHVLVYRTQTLELTVAYGQGWGRGMDSDTGRGMDSDTYMQCTSRKYSDM